MTIDDGNLLKRIDMSPPPVKQFINKYGGVLIMAAFEDYDIPLYGNQSDWGPVQHAEILSAILEFDDEVLGDLSLTNDDLDYMSPYYGADGDLYEIEDVYNVQGMQDDWYDVAGEIGLYQAIHSGFVSQQWLRAAQIAKINLDDKQLIDKIEKAYRVIDSME